MIKDLFKKFKWLNANFKNPITVGMFNQGIINECTLKFKDSNIKDIKFNQEKKWIYELYVGLYISNDNLDNIMNLLNAINSDYETFTFDGIVIKIDSTSLVFFEPDDYGDKISFENRVVIDIGANVADTALKFAKKGAIVHAFEAMPSLCDIANENIELNHNLKDNIYFYNKAISSEPGKLTLYEYDNTTHSQYDTDNGIPHEVDAVTIDYILTELNVKADVLKIDCEGCEYNIILNSDLSMFNDIILEYHAFITKKPYSLLVDKLEGQGFTVDVYENEIGPIDDIGIIHAHK